MNHSSTKQLSIVIPTLNEQGNVQPLVSRIHQSLTSSEIEYEIIFIDDHSTDITRGEIQKLIATDHYAIQMQLKQGKSGKAYSLLQGFKLARYELIAILDADMQYPPEKLPEMVSKILGKTSSSSLTQTETCDVVVANRKQSQTQPVRRLASKTFKHIFGKKLHGLDCDVQSGMKVFRKEIIERIHLNPTPWTFDLEFLRKARHAGYKIGSVNIEFCERKSGESKVDLLKSSWEIAWSSVKQKFSSIEHIPFHPQKEKIRGKGFNHKGKEYVHHTDLPVKESAFHQFTTSQKVIIISLLAVLIAGLFINWQVTLIWMISFMSIYYFADLTFNAFLTYRTLTRDTEIKVTKDEINRFEQDIYANHSQWPKYSILCPLYKEWQIVPQFVEAMKSLQYPSDRLQILFLLEEDDQTTIRKVGQFDLPPYFKIVVVPHSMPKTKPKACNYGLSIASGEYVVIYDAEDKPDPLQLKQSVLAFQKSPQNTLCVQAKLNYYNPHQNLLTRLFTSEYSLWFDLILPGLQSINAPIPLGGTSNHFKTADLIKLHRWDAFNVTEDCDLGLRLAKRGYRTAIVDSTTWEEANSEPFNWYKQRTRWIKGYIQTYFVHMRDTKHKSSSIFANFKNQFYKPSSANLFAEDDQKNFPSPNMSSQLRNRLFFQLTVGGKVLSILINPIMWLTTAAYFLFRPWIGTLIESLFIGPVFYIAVASALFGNFIYLYSYMIGVARRGQYELMKYIYLVPFYWVGMSIAAWRALYEIFVMPHYWAKTKHGLHLQTPETVEIHDAEDQILAQPQPAYAPQYISANSAEYQFSNQIPVQNLAPAELEQSSKPMPEPSIVDDVDTSTSSTRTQHNFSITRMFSRIKSVSAVGAPLIISTVLVNLLNFVYKAYLGNQLSAKEFGTISLIGSLIFFAQIPLGVLARSIAYQSSAWLGKHNYSNKLFWRTTRITGFKAGLIITSIWLIFMPTISRFFHLSGMLPLYLFTPVWLILSVFAVDDGFRRGSHAFTAVGIVMLTESLVKLGLSYLLVSLGLSAWIYAVIPFSMFVGLTVGWVAINLLKNATENGTQLQIQLPKNFISTSFLIEISGLAFLNIDIILAKHFLPPVQAGQYALLSLSGKMIYWSGSVISQFMVPLVSKRESRKRSTKTLFYQLIFASTTLQLFTYFVIGLMGSRTAPLLFGQSILPVIHLLPVYGAASLLFGISNNIISYHQIKQNYLFPVLGVFLSGVQIIILSFLHQSVEIMAYAMLLSSSILFEIIIIANYFSKPLRQFISKIKFELQIFENPKPVELPDINKSRGKALNILIFNWRDIKHIWSGGAEVYLHEIAKSWVNSGHNVTIFASNDQRSEDIENVDGITVIRKGGFFTVYIWAIFYYLTKFRGKYDLVIDSENGIPFFSPLYVQEPVLLLVYHVHQQVYFNLQLSWYKKPFAIMAKIMESHFMPLIYKANHVLTISESTQSDLIKLGFKNENISVVHPGVDLDKFRTQSKTDYPSLLYLGRLQAYKSIETVIQAMPQILRVFPKTILKIAGSGEHRSALEKLAVALNLQNSIRFLGKVSEPDKVDLLGQSWALVYPSLMEGWGITAIEASASGTPVIASDVPGLRDSVKNPHTGILVEKENPQAFAREIVRLFKDDDLRKQLQKGGLTWSRNFSWNKSAQQIENIIINQINTHSARLGLEVLSV